MRVVLNLEPPHSSTMAPEIWTGAEGGGSMDPTTVGGLEPPSTPLNLPLVPREVAQGVNVVVHEALHEYDT